MASVVVLLPRVTKPRLALVEKRLVELAVVLKRLVLVAEVPVALTKVKFCKVEEALTKRLPVVVSPAIVAELTERRPFASIESAAVVEVAKVVADEVAK